MSFFKATTTTLFAVIQTSIIQVFKIKTMLQELYFDMQEQ